MLEPAPVLLDGAWVPSSADSTRDVRSPVDDRLVGVIPLGGAADADAAVSAAAKAAPGWARTPAGDRAEVLRGWARRLRESVDEIAELQSAEGGKPLGDSRGGVLAGISAIEQYAELGPVHRGRSLQGGWQAADLMVFEPRGVAVVLTPWNDPVAIACQGIAANLAVGNTVVFKPSERTPLSGARLVELLAAPAGVVNLVHGDGQLGRALVANRAVDVVLHTGSSRTGREIAVACARTGAKAILEGGGKDACIVDEGVDPRWAARQVALGAFANAGQICVSVERVFVHRSVADAFLAELVRAAGETEIGPMVDREQRAIVAAHVQDAVERGAAVLAGATVPDGPGAYYPPTVLVGCTDDMRVFREETFGPVAAVAVVESFDEALRRAADSDYGLAATVLTPSMAHAQRAWRELPVGTVKINAVFGGAPGGAAEPHRGSGQGFGYGPELLDELATVKVVHLAALPT